jgi:hypothetical protein
MTILGLCNNIGATYQDLGRDREAAPYLRRAATLAAQWIGADNPDTLSIQANLAGLEAKVGDPLRAAEIYDSIAQARAKAGGADSYDCFVARYGHWDALWIAKRFDEAAAGYRALLPDIERSLGEKHWLATQTRVSLARTLLDGGHAEEASPLAARGRDEFLVLYGPEHARTKTAAALVRQIEEALRRPPQAQSGQ